MNGPRPAGETARAGVPTETVTPESTPDATPDAAPDAARGGVLNDSPPEPNGKIGDDLTILAVLIAAWLASVLAGLVALSMPGALGAGHPVSFSRAVFTAFNAATATGFAQQFARPEDFSTGVQVTLAIELLTGLWLSWVGGAVVLRRVLNIAVSLRTIVMCTLILTALGALCGAGAGTGESVPHILFRGIELLTGAGPGQAAGAAEAKSVFAVMVPVAIVGALGPLALVGLGSKIWRRHAANVLAVLAGEFIVGTLLLAALLKLDRSIAIADALAEAARLFFAGRGFGVPVDFASAWPRGVAWTVMALSPLGLGTLGAMPSLGFATLLTFRRRIWPTLLLLIAAEATAGLMTMLVLLQTEPQLSADRILLLVCSAAAKTGLTHEAVSIAGPGLTVLAIFMAFSKSLPLMLLFAPRSNRHKNLQH